MARELKNGVEVWRSALRVPVPREQVEEAFLPFLDRQFELIKIINATHKHEITEERASSAITGTHTMPAHDTPGLRRVTVQNRVIFESEGTGTIVTVAT